MKKFKYFWMLVMAVMTLSLPACSDDDAPEENGGTETDNGKGYHFDLWVALDRHGGMGRDVQTLVRSVNALDNPEEVISFQGQGTEVNSVMSLETIYRGAYYYQVPVSGDRFSKYVIKDNEIQKVAEHRFKTNTYSTRKYCHAWLNDNTLLIMAANGAANEILWTKLNTSDMSIIAEGTLDLPLPPGAAAFTTSGIVTYRKSDNKLFYFYYGKASGGRGARTSPFYVAVINADNMNVDSNNANTLADEMVGSAYGELLQKCCFTDEQNNIYLACFSSKNDVETSHLLRINAGETDFDPDYDGFTNPGKLISVEYAGNGKAVAYARDDQYGTDINSFAHYYTIIDLNSGTNQRLMYNGQPLAYSGGRFSSRMAAAAGNVYVGVNAQGAAPQIYIYNVATGNVIKGAQLQTGIYFEQIRVLENL